MQEGREEEAEPRRDPRIPSGADSDTAQQDGDVLHALFVRHDTDRDGRLSVGEFRALMHELGDDMPGEAVAAALQAMDVSPHGVPRGIEEDQVGWGTYAEQCGLFTFPV